MTATQRPLLLVGLGTALVLVTYVTPMATVPDTAASFGSGTGARAWILSSMSVGLAAGLLASGAIGDAVGRLRTYLVGLALMGLGSLLCALAPTSLVFVLARVLEGIGGAAVLACGLALLAAAFPAPLDRARATGTWGASVGIGITSGALLAAALDLVTGWRTAYVVVAALALALALGSRRGLAESVSERPRRLDVAGVLVLAIALTLLVSALTELRTGLTATGVLLGVPGLVLLGVFVVVELRVAEPMLDLGLFRSVQFLAATVAALSVGVGIIGLSSNLPLLVVVGLGDSLVVGTLVVLGWSATSVVTSLLLRRIRVTWSGPVVIVAALLVVALGQLLALGVQETSTPWRLLPSMVVAGLGTGVLNAVMGREAVASVPPEQAAMGSGSNNTARYLGAAIGITLGSVLIGHAGGSPVAGWSTAVLVTTAATLTGAAVIGVALLRARDR